MALEKSIALAEARKRGKLGKPHRVVAVYAHAATCLYSDGTCIPLHPCTCKRAKLTGYTLVLV
jgi:hypothetical protein